MIYNGCRYLLQYGYVTAPHCEVCALESDDINIEEHHAVRSAYLERTRQRVRSNNDQVDIRSCSGESTVAADLSSDEDEELVVASPLSWPIEVELVEAPMENDHDGMRSSSDLERTSEKVQVAEESRHQYSPTPYRRIDYEEEPPGGVFEASTMPTFLAIACAKAPMGNCSAVDNKTRGSPVTQELQHRRMSTSDIPRFNVPEVDSRLPLKTTPATTKPGITNAAVPCGKAPMGNSSAVEDKIPRLTYDSQMTHERHHRRMSTSDVTSHNSPEVNSRLPLKTKSFATTPGIAAAAAATAVPCGKALIGSNSAVGNKTLDSPMTQESNCRSVSMLGMASHSASESQELQRTQFASATTPTSHGKAPLKNNPAFYNQPLGSHVMPAHCRYVSPASMTSHNAQDLGLRQLQRAELVPATARVKTLNSYVDDNNAYHDYSFPSRSRTTHAESVPGTSRESIISSPFLTPIQSEVNQQNSGILCSHSSAQDSNLRNTDTQNTEDIQAKDLSNAVSLGLSLSQMIMSSLQSALAQAEQHVSASSPLNSGITTDRLNLSGLDTPVTAETVHFPKSSPPVGSKGSVPVLNYAFAPHSTNACSSGTTRCTTRGLYPHLIAPSRSRTTVPDDTRGACTSTSSHSAPYTRNPPISNAYAPHGIPEMVNRASIPPIAHQPKIAIPSTSQALPGEMNSTCLPLKRTPRINEVALASRHSKASNEFLFPDSSTKPSATNFCAEWLMISEQQKPTGGPVAEQNFHSWVQNRTCDSAPVRGRTAISDNPQVMGCRERLGFPCSSLRHKNRGRSSPTGQPSAHFEIPVNYSMERNEMILSEHYERQEPKLVRAPKKRNVQPGKSHQADQPKRYRSASSPSTESYQEVVMTPLARKLYSSGSSTSTANPSTRAVPIHRGIRAETSCRSCSAGAPRVQQARSRQVRDEITPPGQVLTSAPKRPYLSTLKIRSDTCDEIIMSPLVKKLHSARNTAIISKPRTTSESIATKVNVPSSKIVERTESVITHASRPTPMNSDLSTLSATPGEATTANARPLVPWSAISKRTLCADQGRNLRPEVPLPPFESIGGHLYSDGIKEFWGAKNAYPSASQQEEDIKYIVEWLMHSATTSDEPPSPKRSLLSIRSGDSAGPSGPAPLPITSGDSGVISSTGPLPMAFGNSASPTVPDPLVIMYGDSGVSSSTGPLPMTSENSEGPTSPVPLPITSGDSGVQTIPASPPIIPESCIQEDMQSRVPILNSESESRVAKSRNRRKLAVPRKKRPKPLKQPASTWEKSAKSPAPPKNTIEHFIIVCEGEAFRVSSKVLEAASPVIRDFSRKCLQAGPTGDCFFEVLGVTPWAMHELLKFVCRNSYNRILMRSSFMKKLADKLKINLNPGENPNQCVDDSSTSTVLTAGDDTLNHRVLQ